MNNNFNPDTDNLISENIPAFSFIVENGSSFIEDEEKYSELLMATYLYRPELFEFPEFHFQARS